MSDRPRPRPQRGEDETCSTHQRPMQARGRARGSNAKRGVRQADAQSRRRMLVGVVSLIFVLLLVGIPVYTAWRVFASPAANVPAGESVHIEIPAGAGTAEIATLLAEAGVIDNATLFRLRAQLDGIDGDLRSGTYDLTTGMDYDAVIAALMVGEQKEYVTVTIPEGFTVKQTAARIEETTGIPAADFTALALGQANLFAAEHPYLADVYGNSLEGYLFPKTYSVEVSATAADVIEIMLDQFDTEMASVDLTAAADRGYSLAQVIAMASIIEREAQLDEERPLVASVIYNRLAIDMRLEMCSTVQYLLAEPKDGLTNDDLKIESPYNTYQNAGLPPGPIASPGLASIQAAANPADTKYLYFVLTGDDGSHTFTESYDDFLNAKAQSKG